MTKLLLKSGIVVTQDPKIGVLPTGGLGGWAPGTLPRRFPDGTGMFLAKGSDLVLQIHYHPDGKDEVDQSTVGIYFTPKPAERIVAGIAVRSRATCRSSA